MINFNGNHIWTDGDNIYYSYSSNQYVLDKSTSAWSEKTWNEFSNINGQNVWTDGENIYYSNGTNNQYVLDKETSTWTQKTWTGLTSFSGDRIWTDGENIYYSYGPNQYILNRATSTWTEKTWNIGFSGDYIWTDKENIYYSNSSLQYVLDKSTSTWVAKTWTGLTSFYGNDIWTDGTNIYYSNSTSQYELTPNYSNSNILKKIAETSDYNDLINKPMIGKVVEGDNDGTYWTSLSIGTDTKKILNGCKIKQKTEWTTASWSNSIRGNYVWTDHEGDVYYSEDSAQYIFNKSTSKWSTKNWTGSLTNLDGRYVWTDGKNTYYSDPGKSTVGQMLLDKANSTWVSKTWTGLTSFYGDDIWTDGENIYYSHNKDQYVLDKTTSTWTVKTWGGFLFHGDRIWTDGDNIYYSNSSTQYVLDKSTSTWSQKTWTGLNAFYGYDIWTDGENIYCSHSVSQSSTQYVLDKATSTWTEHIWDTLPDLDGQYIWTDGKNTYYSYFVGDVSYPSNNKQYILADVYDTFDILHKVAASGSYNDLDDKPTIPDAVSGTNDGTDWTSLTIGNDTYAIPSGSSSGDSEKIGLVDNVSLNNDIVNDAYKKSYYSNDYINTADANIKAVAHRGYSDLAPENTLPAYKLARQRGFTYVECDVRFTSDNIPVCIHDATISRTSDGTGNVADMTLNTLKSYDFGSWKSSKYTGTKIPTLEEFIILCKKLNLKPYIELKLDMSLAQVQTCVDVVKKYSMLKNTTWISFYSTPLTYVTQLYSKCRLGYLTNSLTTTAIDTAATLISTDNEVYIGSGSLSTITSSLVDYVIQNNLTLEVWTIDTVASLNTAVEIGANGVTTNKLNVAYELEKDNDFERIVYCYNINDIENVRYEFSDTLDLSRSYIVSNVGDFGTTYNQFALAKYNKYVYFFGGYFGNSQGTSSKQNVIKKFDMETNTLTTLSITMPDTFAQGCAATVGDYIYIFGGMGDTNSATSKKVYRFNCLTETIETLSALMPVGLGWTVCDAYETDIYIFGGNVNMSGTAGNAVNTIYKFDTINQTFTLCNATLNATLYGGACIYIGNGKFNLYGGQTNSSGHVNTIQQYNAIYDSITVLNVTLPYKLAAEGVCMIGNSVYLIGGYSSSATNKIIEHNLTNGEITTLSETLPYSAYYSFARSYNRNMFTFGGKNSISSITKIAKGYSDCDLAIRFIGNDVEFYNPQN